LYDARTFERRMVAMGGDPVARLARASYKIGTRSTLPYLQVAFALVGQTFVLLVIIAIGSHLYWTITLYIWYAPLRASATSRPSAQP
jgi:hypothetical protein